MLAFWIEIKRRLKTTGVALVTAGASLLLALAYLFSRRSKQYAQVHEGVFEQATQRVAAANAQAAIEIHVAETKEAAVHAELTDIGQDSDGDRRRQRLIELAARVEGGKS